MSLIPTTLTLFINTACAQHPELPGLSKWSIGIFYDSSRLAKFNASEALPSNYSHTRDMAFQYAIRYAVDHAPRHYNLIIETDDEDNEEDLNLLLSQHRAKALVKLDLPVEDWPAHGTIKRIDARTKRGDCWVDIVYSGEDADAQTGLDAARELARSALVNREAEAGVQPRSLKRARTSLESRVDA